MFFDRKGEKTMGPKPGRWRAILVVVLLVIVFGVCLNPIVLFSLGVSYLMGDIGLLFFGYDDPVLGSIFCTVSILIVIGIVFSLFRKRPKIQ